MRRWPLALSACASAEPLVWSPAPGSGGTATAHWCVAGVSEAEGVCPGRWALGRVPCVGVVCAVRIKRIREWNWRRADCTDCTPQCSATASGLCTFSS